MLKQETIRSKHTHVWTLLQSSRNADELLAGLATTLIWVCACGEVQKTYVGRATPQPSNNNNKGGE